MSERGSLLALISDLSAEEMTIASSLIAAFARAAKDLPPDSQKRVVAALPAFLSEVQTVQSQAAEAVGAFFRGAAAE